MLPCKWLLLRSSFCRAQRKVGKDSYCQVSGKCAVHERSMHQGAMSEVCSPGLGTTPTPS